MQGRILASSSGSGLGPHPSRMYRSYRNMFGLGFGPEGIGEVRTSNFKSKCPRFRALACRIPMSGCASVFFERGDEADTANCLSPDSVRCLTVA